ncbi:MAG: N5-carboxyaminoimidazole ribonucleotide synthase [Ignavibacteriaceae bacterium]|nr:MAG: N5-carboxyaminoimidazole ribonucleotide synthase [Ignavibacteriaceae bacterium]
MLTIGFLGGGQLAKMSALAAYRLGFKVAVFESIADSPAGMMTKLDFTGSLSDDKRLAEFASVCDIITLENEFIDPDRLRFIESLGKPVFPSPETIEFIQDKLVQKETLRKSGLPVPDFVPVSENDTYTGISKLLGPDFILKSRKMGYDGYGNHFVRNEADMIEGMKKLTKRHASVMAEKVINFTKELAVMVAVNSHEVGVYPVVETIQEHHICKFVIAPAVIPQVIADKAARIASEAVRSVKGKGIFGVELFLTSDDEILVNEMAPRPHNSGHYTIEGCITSQFENHIRAILELPLGNTWLVKPCSIMVNTLGKHDGEGKIFNLSEILFNPDAHLHFYGKTTSRKGRKMGHITMNGDDPAKILKELTLLEKKIKIGKDI